MTAERADRVEYTDELGAEICAELVEGESLTSICRRDGFPNVATVYRWLSTHDKFRELYALARQDQANTLGDQILEISDETPVLVRTDEDGKVIATPIFLDGAAVQRQRLRVDARKFVAAKLLPSKWGDRTEVVGANGQPLVPDVLDGLTDDQRLFETARRLAFIFAKAVHLQDDQPAQVPRLAYSKAHDAMVSPVGGEHVL